MEQEVARLLQCQKEGADPFKILKVDIATCTVDDVAKTFRKIVVLVHPDKCKLPQAADAFHVAEKAYRLLEVEKNILRLRQAAERKTQTADRIRRASAAAASSNSSTTASSHDVEMTTEERRTAMKRDRLHEAQLEAARLAEESDNKRRRVEEQREQQANMAVELKRQAEEWRAMQQL